MHRRRGEPADAAAALLDAVVAQQERVAAAQAELTSMVLSFADQRIADDQADRAAGPCVPGRSRPGEFVADELSLALRIPVWEAQRLLARSRRLRTGLPAVWAAGLAGRLDQPRLVRIDRAARLVLDPQVLTELDEAVVEVAATKTVRQLDSWLERFLAEREPDAYAHRHQVSYADRNVSVAQALHGVGYVSALVSGPDAQLIDGRLDTLARACGSGDARTHHQRRSDLFADILLDRVVAAELPADLAGPDRAAAGPVAVDTLEVEVIDPDTGEYLGTRNQPVDADGEAVGEPGGRRLVLQPREGVPATIGVIVPLSTLTGDTDRPGQLADRSGCLPADQVRDLAAQPGTLFYRLLTDPQGHLLDVTRMGRFATGQLGFAVRLRAGSCGFPTCTVPADGAISIITSRRRAVRPTRPTSVRSAAGTTGPRPTPRFTAGATSTRPTGRPRQGTPTDVSTNRSRPASRSPASRSPAQPTSRRGAGGRSAAPAGGRLRDRRCRPAVSGPRDST